MSRSEPSDESLPHVAIVGRPNVGKSTLFNRIVGRRQAIVGSTPGMTRDRHQAEADWEGRRFLLVDTGGLELGEEAELPQRVRSQALHAVSIADLVLFVVDGRDGLLPMEEEIARLLRRHDIPVLAVVNKCDRKVDGEVARADFFRLGIEPLIPVSAEQGRGIGRLLDEVVARLPETAGSTEVEAPEAISVAVVGRPNVGKSSMVNALLGVERVVVSEIPGTTRDAVDSLLERDGRSYRIIDTAGIRKRGRLDSHAEVASVAVARRRIRRADVALLLIDPHEGVTRQDLHLADQVDEAGCGLIVVVNKWDTVRVEEGLPERFVRYAGQRLGRLAYAPVAFTSALYGTGVESLLHLVDRVQQARSRRVATARLNELFEKLQERDPGGARSRLRPKYLTQVAVRPPVFVVFAGGRVSGGSEYRRYVENRLREAFDFTGSPIVVRIRGAGKRRAGKRAGQARG